ncbi:uncharacterized protein [Haliotis asinina]|uniref:uncharacterized protein n=1 Tax=Haliotis asinina TaxID=109174 RepID=UPI00353194AE
MPHNDRDATISTDMHAPTVVYIMISSLFLTVSQGAPLSERCGKTGDVDARGFYPLDCYSMVNDNGDCLFERVIPKGVCMAVYGERGYNELVSFQNDLNKCYYDLSCTQLPRID